jgi:hypothetical protein
MSSAQHFEGTHRGKVCIDVFIRVSVRAWNVCVALCNLKKA